MMHFMKRAAAGVVAVVMSAGVASALPVLNISGGAPGVVPGAPLIAANDALVPLGFTAPLSGFYGSQITLSGMAGSLMFTLLGAEAGFQNQFKWTSTGDTLTNSPGTSFNPLGVNGQEGISSFVVNSVATGTLGFTFGSLDNGSSVANGTNPNGSPTSPDRFQPNFFATFADGTRSGSTLYLFFDDNGVADDNHDDLVIKVQVVPLPAAAWLLLGVSGVLVAAKRRNNRRAA